MDLAGKQVVVVGGTSGMGLATARAAAERGAAVTVVSSRRDRVDAALAELPEGCTGEALDVREEAAVAALFERVGELDHLVFTAGDAFTPQLFADLNLQAARASMDVRFWGAVTAVKYASPRLRAGGTIALTTGTVSRRPVPGAALAAAGAAAAEGLVRALAAELAPLRVNAVRAGAVRTPMWDRVPETQRDAVFVGLGQRTLLGRLGESEELARAHLFLMENDYVTGTVLTVDGGLLLAAG